LAPDARAADVLLSDELAAVDDAKLAAMAKETLRYLDSRDQKVLARFFRNDDLPDRQVAWPRRFGYLVGYNVAARLGRHKNLQQLTALTPAEADGPIRATLRALARRGGDSSNRRPRP